MARWSSQTTHNDISDFSDNPHLKRELKIWRLKIAAVVLVVLTVIGLSIKPAYHAFRENRINRNLEAAKEAARLEDWGTARDRARSVLLARENDFEAYRIWTRALGKMGEPRTYMAAASLFADPRATEVDKLEGLRVMALQAPQAVALSAYASLPDDLRDRADYRAAITPLLVLRGEVVVAEQGLREVIGGGRPSPAVRLELLRVLCSRPEAARVKEARQIFADLAREQASSEALDALLILGEVPGALAPGSPLPDLPAWVADQPKATALHHLVALHPALEAGAKEPLFQEAIERFRSTEPGVLGTWLTRHGEAGRVINLLEESAKVRSDAYIARLHALLREAKEAELAEALKSPPESADMVEMEMIHALMALRRKDETAAAAAWTRALNHAAFDATRNRFIEIAKIAESHGARAAAVDAWVGAIRFGWGQLPLCRDLTPVISVLGINGRSEDLLAICRTLLRFEPLNPDLINNVQYLGLIHGVFPADQVITTSEGLLSEHPEMPEIHSVLMLAEMKLGRSAEALRRVPELRKSRRISPMMLDALEGSVRILAGETEAGAELLGKVRWAHFMRQERIAFRDLLVTLKIADLPLPELEPETSDGDPDSSAWRKAIEAMERDRSADVLPALPPPVVPGSSREPESP